MKKNNLFNYTKMASIFLLMLFVLTACPWTAETYQKIESIKNDALALVEKSATDNYDKHKSKVEGINKRIEAITSSQKNKEGVKMLQMILDKGKNTWGGFTELWKKQGKMSTAMVPALKTRITQAFNEVLGLGQKE